MGYRSDVCLTFYCAKGDMNYAALKFWVEENMRDDLDSMDPMESVNWKGFVFRWESVKWYDGYDDVDRVTKAMHNFCKVFELEADDDTPEFSYEFIRIGENDDDVEIERSRDAVGLLSVHRSIECEF